MNDALLNELTQREYQHGFVTDVETESIPAGLSEDVVRIISKKKNEPEWLLEWRLKAYRHWLTMEEPTWARVSYPPIDYQKIVYYAAPKSAKEGPKSLADVDPELLAMYEKLGVPLKEREILAGVAVDAVIDSVSVATTFREKLASVGIIFCSFSEAVHTHPDLVRKWLGSVVPSRDNFFAALNSAVFSDGSFCYIPKGVRCPMELSTYFRINQADTGQFERTLIVAEEGATVSYLEGCTAPKRDVNQLHAAVVELVALDDATIKYSTVQNWYPGDREGKGGIYNFVTKRGKCLGKRSKISWTQVETGSAITWKYPSCILMGDDSIGEFYSVALANNYQQADTGHEDDPHREEHPVDDRLQGHLRGPRPEHVPRRRHDPEVGRGRAQLLAVRLAPHRRPVRRAHVPVHRGQEQLGHARARGVHVEDRRGPALLLHAARDLGGRRRVPHRQRLRQARPQGAPDGVRGGSAEAPGRFARRIGRMKISSNERAAAAHACCVSGR